MALAVLAAAAMCALVRAWDPPLGYRTGDTPGRDLTARVDFSVAGPPAGPARGQASASRAERNEAAARYRAGQTLVPAGRPLGPADVKLLRAEHEAAVAERPLARRLYRAAAMMALVLGLFALAAMYFHLREPQMLVSLRRLVTMLALAVLTVGLAYHWAAADTWRVEVIPLLLFGQTAAIAYRREPALLLAGVVVLVAVIGVGGGLAGLVVLMGVTATAVLQLGSIRNRSKLIYAGCVAAAGVFLLSVAAGLLSGRSPGASLLRQAGSYAACTFAAGFLMTGLLPFVEKLFGVLTDVSLLELGDVSHPLLQELVRRAPSTYNHSITVGVIAEAAAGAIGARGLLVRVGAYFHDIGKMLKPEYFIENQPPDANRHESLIPAMSTLVIIAHIKDGANLARNHKLPQPIIDFIEQHHGTTLVEYFYGRAAEMRKADPEGGEVDESSFRYPGPRPQTKEAAVLMLADAAESACRSLIDPAPSRIEGLVREVTERKLDDGQFDECNLTLRELRTVQNTMIKTLIANYHGRVKYPGQRTA
jgi:putative nucleotidyltransferase with HDIG domain